MALFKSQEEREQEARDREAAERAAAVREAERQRDARAAAEAATPVGRARAARARGERFFQIELQVSALEGYASVFDGPQSRSLPREDTAAELGRIEDEGWRLEHAGFVFVETGAASTGRLLGSGESTATQGSVMGVYLFRRTAEPTPA